MFSKRKGFSWVALLIVIFVIVILSGGMMLPGIECSVPASIFIAQLHFIKDAGIKFLGDNTDLTWIDLLSVWPTLNAGGTSFDKYMKNSKIVRELLFAVFYNAPPDNGTWLMVGRLMSDPIVADRITGRPDGALFNANGGAFTRNDSVVFMRVK